MTNIHIVWQAVWAKQYIPDFDRDVAITGSVWWPMAYHVLHFQGDGIVHFDSLSVQ